MVRVGPDTENEAGLDAMTRETLETLHALEDKLARGLGLAKSKHLSSLCDDLADLAMAGERVAEIVRGILASGDTTRSLVNAFAELEAESVHMAWHVRSLRRNLEWVHHLLDKGRGTV
ncbi:MAG: hypothetical protein AB1816_06680 [Bacillota bacterium]